MKRLFGCIGKNGREIDSKEFEIDTLEDFVKILQSLKDKEMVHLNYFENESDLDLWVGWV